MSTAKTNGTTYSVPPNTKNSGSNNNGGSIIQTTTSDNLSSISPANPAGLSTTVVSGVNTEVAVYDGVFANDSRGVIMRGTDSIAGLSNDFFVHGANDGQKVPTKTESSTISRIPLVQRDETKYTYSTKTSSPRTSDGIRNSKFNVSSGAWDSGFPTPSVAYWGTPKLRRVDGPARYFLPNMNEFHKAAYYDPTIGDVDDTQNYWLFATRTNDTLAACEYDSRGNGIPASDGHSANYGGGGGTSISDPTSGWNSTTTWREGQNGKGFLTVGSCGGPSYYGTYDQNFNILNITEGYGGGSLTTTNRFVALGGSVELNVPGSCSNYGPRYQLRYSDVAGTVGYSFYGFRIASLDNQDRYSDLVFVGDPGNSADNAVCSNAYMGYGLGAVNYTYYIGKFDITNDEYCTFLNSVATDDTYGLYRTTMGDNIQCGIIRTGSAGNYSYSVNDDAWKRKPAAYLGWYSAARYCNWLHNGKPVGPQVAATTEDGAYTLNGNVTTSVLRNS